MSKVKVKTKEEIFQDDSFILALENAGGVMVDFKSFGQRTLKDAIAFYLNQDYTKFSPGELTKSKAELKELRKHIPNH